MFQRVHWAMLVLGSWLALLPIPPARSADDARTEKATGPYAAWKNGPGQTADTFPVAVWLQDPRNAPRYKALGINLYVALWRGPNAAQIAELKKYGMPVICDMNAFARAHLDERIIVGWMHGDQPDNAQELGQGQKGYGPPILPEKIERDYTRIQAADPSRPVMLNLGQGVAWDGYYGRGVRTNHPEDYPEYIKGGDIISFDIYPAVHDHRDIAGKLWYVAHGVNRLRQWGGNRKVVWNCIECTHIGNAKVKPTPEQVKAEVWMSIIHGSQGLIYFCHQFAPRFVEAGLLADEDMARAVTGINRQVQSLAAVINSPVVTGAVRVDAVPADVSPALARALETGPIALTVRRRQGATYVFAVRLEAAPVRATFHLPRLMEGDRVEVIGEERTLSARKGEFRDEFAANAVHLYRISR